MTVVNIPDIDRCRYIASSYEEKPMSQVLDPVTQHHVRQAAEALADEFEGIFSEETIERYIGESLDLLGDARINVVRAGARAPLRARAAEGARPGGRHDREGAARGAVRLRAQRRAQPDGRRPGQAPLGGRHPRPLGGQRPGDEINPAVVDGDGGARRRHERGVPEAADRRGRARRRRRHHDGLRRCLPDLPGQDATRTGSSTTRPARTSTPCGGSATRSTRACRR